MTQKRNDDSEEPFVERYRDYSIPIVLRVEYRLKIGELEQDKYGFQYKRFLQVFGIHERLYKDPNSVEGYIALNTENALQHPSYMHNY